MRKLAEVGQTAPNHTEFAAERSALPIGNIAYMRPEYVAMSAWIEHVPFAFWLIDAVRPKTLVELGTHWGVSYFGFCQALEKLGIGNKSFAVDTWTGDEHSGLYGSEIYTAVMAHNDKRYSHFSTLVKSKFDDASAYFLDGTVDLLHIDGLHTYDAVRHDFETWLPKISSRGVVVLHDTNVRERNFGVFQLFSELTEAYPTFEFVHGHGLGVVGVGAEQSGGLLHLFHAARDSHERQAIQTVFASLGKGAHDAQNDHLRGKVEPELARLREAVSMLQGKGKEALSASEAAERLRVELTEANNALHLKQQELESLREKLEGYTTAQSDNDRVTLELQAQIGRLVTDLGTRFDEIANVTRLLWTRDSEVAQLAGKLEEMTVARQDVVVAAESRQSELQTARAAVEESRVEVATLQRQQQEERAKMERLLVEAREKVAGQERERIEAVDQVSQVNEAMARQKLQMEDVTAEVRKALKAALTLPNAWSLLPGRIRLKRQTRLLQRVGVFDPEWYLRNYPDVAADGGDPARHFAEHGLQEGRAPNGSLAIMDNSIRGKTVRS